MRKFLLALVLAFNLTCAFTSYTASNYAVAPLSVASDIDLNFTYTNNLFLASITPGDVYLVSANATSNPYNASNSYWSLWYRKLDSRNLKTGVNSTSSIIAPPYLLFYNNYAVGFSIDNDTGVYQIRACQVSLTSGIPLPRLTVSTNRNPNFTPSIITLTMIGDTVYIFYYAAYQKVNITYFVVGSSTVGTPEYFLSATFDTPDSLSVAWGQSLGDNQLFAAWVENGFLKDSAINVKNMTYNYPNIVSPYNSSFSCYAFATNQKWYGELCTYLNIANGAISYYTRRGTPYLVPLVTYPANTSALYTVFTIGPYLALMFSDRTVRTVTNYAYEIWNLDNLTIFKNRTTFLSIDASSTFVLFKDLSGALYTLLYNNKQGPRGTLSSIQVGLLLEGYPSSGYSVLLWIALLILAVVVVALGGVYYYRKKRSSQPKPDEKLMSMADEKLIFITDEERARVRRGSSYGAVVPKEPGAVISSYERF